MTLTRRQVTRLTTHELATLVGVATAELASRLAPPLPAAPPGHYLPGARLAARRMMQAGASEEAVRAVTAPLDELHDAMSEDERADVLGRVAPVIERRNAARAAASSEVAARHAALEARTRTATCSKCDETFETPVKRGPAPRTCPTCKGAKP